MISLRFNRRSLALECSILYPKLCFKRALNFRREQPELFATGAYQPLHVIGSKKNHVIAFSRTLRSKSIIVATGRFFSRLGAPEQLPIGQGTWDETFIVIEKKIKSSRYRNVLTGETLRVNEQNNISELPLAEVFSRLPVALLELI